MGATAAPAPASTGGRGLPPLRGLEALARARLDPAVFDYVAGGAGDEVTLSRNEAAFARFGIVPRVLRSTGSEADLSTALLGTGTSMPVVVAPTAFHRLAHPEGELATARAARDAGAVMIVSMAATVTVEEIAAASHGGPGWWFQLYVQPDLAVTEALVQRVVSAGCRALVVSVDSPVFGRRERDLRNGFTDLPPGIRCENVHPRSIDFFAGLDWSHVSWLRSVTDLPIVLKGITHPADAALAVEQGVDGIIVSNHGGRQLDTVPATLDLLPDVAAAVDGRLPVLVDGGVRRGTDVVTALGLGAAAVGVGRPVWWALAVAGADGVTHVLETLRSELSRALVLAGCASAADVTPDQVRRCG